MSHKDSFKRYKNPRAFEVLFNLISPDIDNVKQQLVDAKNKIADTKTEIVGLKSYLRDKDAEDYTTLWLKHEHNLNEIETRSKEKASIVNDSKGNRNEETEMYATLKKDLTGIVNQIVQYEREKNDYLLSVSSKKFLRQDYDNEREEILATLELNYTLVIPDQTIECPLCKSLVPHRGHESREANSVGTLKKIEEELKRKIQLVTRMIDNDNKAIQELDQKISQMRKRQAIFSDAAMEFTKELDVPFLSQIDSINSIINQLNMEQEILKECLRMHRKITEKGKLIEDLEGEVGRLNAELDNLYVSEALTNSTFAFLTQQYKQFMGRLKYEVDAETYIHADTYLPYYRGSNVYSHESGGLQLCMQLSYLFAIISSKSEGYCSGHPGILMLDSLSKYLGTLKSSPESRQTIDEVEKPEKDLINDPEVYDEIYKIVVELSSEYQIIIVENTPPSLVNNCVKYTFLSGEKGLINPEVNEFSKID
ncbi:hypothetical protein NZD89_00260 [Alicyclobacillus fastidiosus]|uniref:Exonuclease SbcC n=1 Tax=Alicyclobacillus fastidiosus TaxID=392011 RepID=A0ABY6ZGJ5_9BACL|nr:hypothetical protein [Alicyclobacillus fastidiosus]WAH41998.1 hypothetical protein NZD89_00260 [Alicyclobacillus fastidiosus]GMA63735.1 hypothetical protein GCM10025859_41750 [Alicyclobacillus fastidiosus]